MIENFLERKGLRLKIQNVQTPSFILALTLGYLIISQTNPINSYWTE